MYPVTITTNVLKMDVAHLLDAGIHQLRVTITTIVLLILAIPIPVVSILISSVNTLTLANVLIVSLTSDVFITIFGATIATIVLQIPVMLMLKKERNLVFSLQLPAMIMIYVLKTLVPLIMEVVSISLSPVLLLMNVTLLNVLLTKDVSKLI
jgi:hypothetical protein